MTLSVVLVCIIAYLLGSIPFGLLLSRWWAKVDIRKFGSGNIGMSNVMRTLGYPPAALTLLLDGGKGLVSVMLARLVTDQPVIFLIVGLFAIAGHNWPVFLNFKGGKGVATAAGVFIGAVPSVTLSLLGIWLIVVLITRYISLASVIAAISLPFLLAFFDFPWSVVLVGIIVSVFILIRHLSNIKRLIAGTEYRVGEKGRER